MARFKYREMPLSLSIALAVMFSLLGIVKLVADLRHLDDASWIDWSAAVGYLLAAAAWTWAAVTTKRSASRRS